MSKVKIIINNASQWADALQKAKAYGAISRDGSTVFLPSKPDMVIDTNLSATTACILSSRSGYLPKKKPYAQVISFKDFMNTSVAPWSTSTLGYNGPSVSPATKTVVQTVEVPVYVPVPTPVGVCAQTTLRISAVEVVEQQSIIFNTVGIPWLKDNGLEITEDDGKMYLVDSTKNTADLFTAKTAAVNATESFLDNDTDDIWARYAIAHDLIVSITHSKEVEEEED